MIDLPVPDYHLATVIPVAVVIGAILAIALAGLRGPRGKFNPRRQSYVFRPF